MHFLYYIECPLKNYLVNIFSIDALVYIYYGYSPMKVYVTQIIFLNKKQDGHNRRRKQRQWESKHQPCRPGNHDIVKHSFRTEENTYLEVKNSEKESCCSLHKIVDTIGNLGDLDNNTGDKNESISKQIPKAVENIEDIVNITSQQRYVIPYCKQLMHDKDDSKLYATIRKFFKNEKNVKTLKILDAKNQETSTPEKEDYVDRIPSVDLFSYRQLKMKPELLIYYNTSSHPDSVRGSTWSNFSSDIYRLSTFAAYPQSSAKSPTLLAAQGFVYIGNGQDDKVLCFFCGFEIVNWRSDDDIEEVHRRMSPRCPKVTSGSGQLLQLTPTDATNVPSEIPTTRLSLNYNDSLSNLNNSLPEFIESIPQDVPDAILRGEPSSASRISRTPNENGNHTSGVNIHARESLIGNALPEMVRQSHTLAPTAPTAQSRGGDSQIVNSTGNETRVSSTETTLRADPITATNNALVSGRNPTYSELGIITERPKRQEYAHRSKRLETFIPWPRDHHLSPGELAEAGFFYAGYGDCTRCFFCGGGLRNWDDGDDVWVEHARWFPRCFYLRQKLGQDFIDVVQNLHLQHEQISITQIRERLGRQSSFLNIDSEITLIRRDAAVESVIRLGFRESDVIEVARLVKQDVESLSSEALIEKLEAEGKQKIDNLIIPSSTGNTALDREQIRQLKERNNQIRHQIICKICLDRDVSVVFLPCGHLVSCGDCSTAMRDCPVCRSHVRGLARAVIY